MRTDAHGAAAGLARVRAGVEQLGGEARHVRGPATAARWLAWAGRRFLWAWRRRRHPEGLAAPTARVPRRRPAPARAAVPPVGPFDARIDNPVGWTANVERRVLALGPRAGLPPRTRARCGFGLGDRDALAHAHHVVDVAAFHADASARAGSLARLAARGVPVRLLDDDPALCRALGAALHARMAAGVRFGDLHAREAASVAMRRLAHRDHALRPSGWPTVSVLLATRRPELLDRAVASVARQRYPRLELVLALHGPGFGAVPAPCRRGLALRVVRVAAGRPLGVALEAAAAAASGKLLAKMDDDDGYDAWHILDLVLARAYSGAALVGKGPEFVYLAGRDVTVRRGAWRAERFTADIAGGGLLIGARDLARAGGWRPLPRGVDQALAADVLAAGDAVYRTHGLGFVIVRHGRGHAWAADESRFLADADAVYRGWRGDLAGVAEDPWFGRRT